MCNQSSRALHRLISAAAQLADKGELFKQQQRRGPALLDLAPKSQKKSVQRDFRQFPVVSEQEVIAHINHNRQKRRWCTFSNRFTLQHTEHENVAYFGPFGQIWAILSRLSHFWRTFYLLQAHRVPSSPKTDKWKVCSMRLCFDCTQISIEL